MPSSSSWSVAIFSPTVTHSPAKQTIWFGANDAVLPHRPQCVPLPKFKENLRTLHSMILSPSSPFYSPSTVVIFITPPPVDLEIRAKDCAARFPDWSWEKMDREVERTRSYAEAVKEVASQVGVESVDVWTAITKEAQGTAEGLGKYLVDGLHLTADGYSVVSRGTPHPPARRLTAG